MRPIELLILVWCRIIANGQSAPRLGKEQKVQTLQTEATTLSAQLTLFLVPFTLLVVLYSYVLLHCVQFIIFNMVTTLCDDTLFLCVYYAISCTLLI